MRIGFIGVGNMARAIIDGLLANKTVAGSDLYLHSGTSNTTVTTLRPLARTS